MRSYRKTQRAAVLAGVVASALAGVAAPASADVAVDPPTAQQGTGVNVGFTVKNDNATQAITAVLVTLPADRPIAEVYPLSVDDWAPLLTSRTLNPPAEGFHGALVGEATATIRWTAAEGKALAPGQSTQLPAAMGPLPSASALTFTVQVTYADGSSAPYQATMSLTAGTGQAPGGHTGHGGAAEPAAPPPVAAPATSGGNTWGVIAWIAAALGSLFGIVATLRARRTQQAAGATAHGDARNASPATKAEKQTDDTKQDTNHDSRPRVTAWSYRDGP